MPAGWTTVTRGWVGRAQPSSGGSWAKPPAATTSGVPGFREGGGSVTGNGDVRE